MLVCKLWFAGSSCIYVNIRSSLSPYIVIPFLVLNCIKDSVISLSNCIMKILFYEVRHFSLNFHEFTGSKTILCQKKIAFFSPKIGEETKFVKIHFRLL